MNSYNCAKSPILFKTTKKIWLSEISIWSYKRINFSTYLQMKTQIWINVLEFEWIIKKCPVKFSRNYYRKKVLKKITENSLIREKSIIEIFRLTCKWRLKNLRRGWRRRWKKVLLELSLRELIMHTRQFLNAR